MTRGAAAFERGLALLFASACASCSAGPSDVVAAEGDAGADTTTTDSSSPPDAPAADLGTDVGRDGGSDVSVEAGDAHADATSPGMAIKLDGTGYGTLPSTAGFATATGFSWELWFRGDAVPTDSTIGRAQILFGLIDGTACEDIYLAFGSEFTATRALTFVVDGLGGCTARDSSPLSDVPSGGGFKSGQWYHVVAVRDYVGSKAQLYVDGAKVAEKTIALAPIARAMNASIGRWYDGVTPNWFFKGTIDELRVYSRALSAGEIAAHYNAGAGQSGVATESGLFSGWHFDESSGALCNDYSGAGRNATLGGGNSHVVGIVPR